MNPVTGRKFSWSWRFAEFQEAALATYSALERDSGLSLLRRRYLARSLRTPADIEAWSLRMERPPFHEVMREPVDGAGFPWLRDAPVLGVLDPVWQVDTRQVIEAVATCCGPWRKGEVRADRELVLEDGIIPIPGEVPVLLAIGGAHSGLLPLRPFKGEALIIRSEDLPEDHIIHHHLKVVPLGDRLFWTGSHDTWDWDTPAPTPEADSSLRARLDQWFRIRYEVVHSLAGIRPASTRRRPLAGPLPGVPNTWVINGLGTKGASLAPMVADDLYRQVMEEHAGDPDFQWPWRDEAPG